MHNRRLTLSERARFDKLFSQIRLLHHLNFVALGISALLASMERTTVWEFLGLHVPYASGVLGLYVVSLALTLACYALTLMGMPFLPRDPRTVPFAWFALGGTNPRPVGAVVWLFVPPFASAFFTAAALDRSPADLLQGVALVTLVGLLSSIAGEDDSNERRLRGRGLVLPLLGGIVITLTAFIFTFDAVPAWRPGLSRHRAWVEVVASAVGLGLLVTAGIVHIAQRIRRSTDITEDPPKDGPAGDASREDHQAA